VSLLGLSELGSLAAHYGKEPVSNVPSVLTSDFDFRVVDDEKVAQKTKVVDGILVGGETRGIGNDFLGIRDFQ
jgi:hypothetical protein